MGQEQETELKMTSVELIEASRRIIAAFIYDPDAMPCKAWKINYAHPAHEEIASQYIGGKAFTGAPLNINEIGRLFPRHGNRDDLAEWERVRAEVARFVRLAAQSEKTVMAQIGGYFADFMKAEMQNAVETEYNKILNSRKAVPEDEKKRGEHGWKPKHGSKSLI